MRSGEQEHQACLCTAGICPSPAHAESGEFDEEAARLGSTKGPECNVSLLDELSASGGDNPLLVAASPNADLHLHLQAGEALSKLFFAMDRLKYKRLWPRYIADMHALKPNIQTHGKNW